MESVSLVSCASLQNQSITGLISNLRSAFRKADFDRVEQVLIAKETQLKAEIGILQEKLEKEWLHRMDLEEKLKKCKDQCENKENNEFNDGEDDTTIAELRVKNRKLEDENRKLIERVLGLEKSEKMFMNGDTHVGSADSSPSGCHSNMESISKTIDCYAERSQLQQGALAEKFFASCNLGSDEESRRAKRKCVIDPSKENALPYPTGSIIIRDQSEEESQKINVHNSGNTSLYFCEGTKQTPLTQKKDVLGGSANGSRGWENVIDIAESDDDKCISGGTLNIGKEATSQIVASSNDNENDVNDVNGKFKRKCVSQSPYGETEDDTSSTSSLLSRI